jgi:hypothetical protein
MKSMKYSFIGRVFFTLILSMAIFGTTLYAQERNLKTELLVYILPDSLELPQMEKGMVSLESIGKNMASKQLRSALISTKASKIGRAFPQWATKDSVVLRSDGEEVKAPAFHRVFIVSFDSEKAADNAISVLSKLPSVKFAERHAEPVYDNDPSYLNGSQWYLNNHGRLGGVVGADINAETAWSIFTGSSAVKLAIIDEGIDLNHNEFSGRVSGDANSGRNHGTLVAGVAAANAMNGQGMRGVDWNAQVLSKKTSDNDGSWLGDNVVAQKITDAVAEGANVLNCSWSFENTLSTTLKMAFDYTYSMDRVVVATMGNTSIMEQRYPSGYRNVMAVGATQNNDVRSPFSTMGAHIDVVAPGGVNIDTSDARNIYTTTPGGGYTFTAGTSFAAPQVAGLASLLKGYKSSLTNDDIRQIIRLTADDNIVPGFDSEYGYGRINAGRALQFINEPNKVVHGESFGGSTTKTNLSEWVYMGDNWGLVAGTYYNVDRYLVTKQVNFSVPFCSPPVVWMRERQSSCISDANPNDGFPSAQVTNITTSGFDVIYYTYYVRYNSVGQTINKWVPSTISNTKIAYTAVGVPNAAGTAGPILGETVICSSNSAFSVQNLPAGCSVSWDKSSNLSYVSGQNTNNYVVKSNGNGEGWIKVTVNSGCGNVTLPQKTVWAGKPVINQIEGPQHAAILQLQYSYSATPYNSTAGATYSWSVSPSYYSIDYGSNHAYIAFPYDGDYRVYASAQNSCGSSNTAQLFVAAGTYEPWKIAPNPASDYFSISLSDSQPNSISDSSNGKKSLEIKPNTSYSLKIINSMGVQVYSTSNMGNNFTVSTSNLKDGIYIVIISDGQNEFKKNIFIKH